MAKLIYSDKDGRDQTLQLDRYTEVTVGRHPECVIQTTNGSVSRRHCSIKATSAGFEIRDLGSSSGTYISQQKIERHILRHGEEVYCGSFVLRFFDDPPAMSAPPPPPMPQVSQAMASVPASPPPPPMAMTGAGGAPLIARARLTYYDDAQVERSVVIGEEHRRVTVGRSPDCTVRTADTSVSRQHSEFLFSQGRVEVVDLESFNGTFVNNDKVSRQVLAHNDKVSCGRLTFAFVIEEVAQRHSASSAGWERQAEPMPQPMPTPQWSTNPQPVMQQPPPTMMPQPVPQPPTMMPQPLMDTGGLQGKIESLTKELHGQQAESQRLRGEAQALQGRVDALQRELEQAKTGGAGDKDRVRELERELRRRQEDLDALRDRNTDLKDQCDSQLRQLDQKRVEVNQRREEFEKLSVKLASMQQELDKGSHQVGNYIEEISSLKSENNQLQRRVEEYKRQVESQSYDLKKYQQQIEDLKHIASSEGQSNSSLQGDLDKLRLVLESKEQELASREEELGYLRREVQDLKATQGDTREQDRLKGELEYHKDLVGELEKKLARAREEGAAAASAAAASAGPSKELEELRGELKGLRRENAELKERAERAEQEGATAGQSQVNELKRSNRDLRYRVEDLEKELEALQGAGPAPAAVDPRQAEESAALRRKLEELERDLSKAREEAQRAPSVEELERLQRENRRLEREASELKAQRGGAGGSSVNVAAVGEGGGTQEKARQVYDALNDAVSQLRNDLQSAEDCAADLRPVIEAIKRLDLKALPALEKARLDNALQNVDPKVALDDLVNLLVSCTETMDTVKDALRNFRRDVLSR